MADHQVITKTKDLMGKRVKAFEQELVKVRTGRASISLLDSVKVDYYGTMTPLNQVATLSTPDARTIVISPFEKKMIQNVEKGIQIADLGLQPNNDGNVVRVPIPALTEDRRKDLVKGIKKVGEDAKVAIRNGRRDGNEELKKLEKDKTISEDESRKLQQEIQKHTDAFTAQIDGLLTKKEKEIMTL